MATQFVDLLGEEADSLLIELSGMDSFSVLDILRENHDVEFTSSAMGAFIKAIDSIENGDGYFWLYSVNDSMAQVACDRYLTDSQDVIKWYFRKVGN